MSFIPYKFAQGQINDFGDRGNPYSVECVQRRLQCAKISRMEFEELLRKTQEHHGSKSQITPFRQIFSKYWIATKKDHDSKGLQSVRIDQAFLTTRLDILNNLIKLKKHETKYVID